MSLASSTGWACTCDAAGCGAQGFLGDGASGISDEFHEVLSLPDLGASGYRDEGTDKMAEPSRRIAGC